MMPRAMLAAMLLAACSGSPASPPPDVPAMDTPSTSDVRPALDVAAEEAAAPRDVPPELAPDVPAEDRVDAALDTSPVDATADVPQPIDAADRPDPCGSPVLRQCDIDGISNCVNITGGRMRPDGTTLHCGRCGNTCAAGMRCSLGNCITL